MDYAGRAPIARIGIFFLSFGLDVFAGMENSLYNLALGLVENGAEIHVYTGCLCGTEERIGEVQIYRSRLLPAELPNGDHTVRCVLTQNASSISAEIREFVQGRRITYSYVCDPLWGIVQLTGAWKHIDIPMTLSLRVLNTDDLLTQAHNIPYALYTAVSNYLREQILSRVRLGNIQVVPNSINVERFCPHPQNGTPKDTPVIFCNARISPEKGIIYLVQGFADVLKVFPKAELWLCGGSFPFSSNIDLQPYTCQVQRTIADLGIANRVRVLPQLRWSEIPNLVRAATIVVVPSLQETFGRAALEAMACGKPVVVTEAGNLPFLVQDAGIVVTPGSAVALSNAIIRILHDDELYAALSSRGPSIASNFSNRLVAHKLLKCIQALR